MCAALRAPRVACLRAHACSLLSRQLITIVRVMCCHTAGHVGLASLIAREIGYNPVYSLDHDPEAIGVLHSVVRAIPMGGRLIPREVDFGAELPSADVVLSAATFPGYCRTGNFTNRMDRVFSHLFNASTRFVIVEWIESNDPWIRLARDANSTGCLERRYNRHAFELAANKHGYLIDKFPSYRKSRDFYIWQRRDLGLASMGQLKWVPPVEGPARTAYFEDVARLKAYDPERPLLACDRDGNLSLTNRSTWLEVRHLPRLTLRLPNGSVISLSQRGWDDDQSSGFTASIFMDEAKTRVLKVWRGRIPGVMERETCAYRRLHAISVPWVPELYCVDPGQAMLVSHSGTELSSLNLPNDYHAQVQRMLLDMASISMRHNDIWKIPHRKKGETNDSITATNSFKVQDGVARFMNPIDMRVKDGQLILYDFGFATINGSFACDKTGTTSHRYFTQSKSDSAVLQLLSKLEQLGRGESVDDLSATGLLFKLDHASPGMASGVPSLRQRLWLRGCLRRGHQNCSLTPRPTPSHP